MFNTGSATDHLRDVPTSPHLRSALDFRGSIPALLATPSSPPGAPLKEIPKPTIGIPDDFISRDDERLFEFVDTLRGSIKARVVAEQLRGLSLSEIVTQVREMTKLAEQAALDPKPFSSSGFRAISKQAVAWCIEAYQPAASVDEQIGSAVVKEALSTVVPTPVAALSNRFSKNHPPTRGLS